MKALTGMRALEAAPMFPPISPCASLAGMLPALPPVLWKETPLQGLGSTSPNWSLQCGRWYLNWCLLSQSRERNSTSRGCCGFVCRTHPAPFICHFFLQSCAANILLPQQVLEAASQAHSPSKAMTVSKMKVQFNDITCSVTSSDLYFLTHFLKGWQNPPSQAISSHYLAQEAALCWFPLQLTPINKRGRSTRAL